MSDTRYLRGTCELCHEPVVWSEEWKVGPVVPVFRGHYSCAEAEAEKYVVISVVEREAADRLYQAVHRFLLADIAAAHAFDRSPTEYRHRSQERHTARDDMIGAHDAIATMKSVAADA